MVTYLHKFIPNLSKGTLELRKLNKKLESFKWNEEQRNDFDKLKQLVSSSKLSYNTRSGKSITIPRKLINYDLS